ncbi:DUF1801 domain-containing protein [Ferruginibacter profundus]
MTIPAFIATQPAERQELLTRLHEIIIQKDKTVTPVIAPMMGKEMIIYNAPGTFKYGLASVKNYMSLHVLPMYGSPVIYEKYKALLKDASFQKGCINFNTAAEIPLKIVKELIADCAKIDLRALREEQLKARAKKTAVKKVAAKKK